MKKHHVLLVILGLLCMLSGCDYYSDESINVMLPDPNNYGLVEYLADVSMKKNAAKLNLLRYELDEIQNSQIQITLPEAVKDTSGTEFPIAAFGGPIGTNAPIREFELIIHIREGSTEDNPIGLTIDAGSLPLDTSYWKDIQICFLSDGTVTQIPLESVIFLSDTPLTYKLYLKEEAENGSVSDATDSNKWYETPHAEYLGGEKVVIRLKHPKDGVDRYLVATHNPPELAEVQEEYMQYEFIMPYHDMRITIIDKKSTGS